MDRFSIKKGNQGYLALGLDSFADNTEPTNTLFFLTLAKAVVEVVQRATIMLL